MFINVSNFFFHDLFSKISPADLKVRVGTSIDSPITGSLFIVQEIIQHELYESTSFDHDMALLILAVPITYNINAQPIPILLSDTYTQYEGSDALVSGWGIFYPNTLPLPISLTSPVRLCAQTTIISNVECYARFNGEVDITDTILCTISKSPLISRNGKYNININFD